MYKLSQLIRRYLVGKSGHVNTNGRNAVYADDSCED